MLRGIVARKLTRVRTRHGEPVREAGGDDIDAKIIRRLEQQQTQNVYLDSLFRICQHYECSILSVVQSSRRIDAWPEDHPEYSELDQLVRRRLRAWRYTAGLGTPSLARLAGIDQPWLVRIESGEYKRLDLVRIGRVCSALERELADLLKPEPKRDEDERPTEEVARPGATEDDRPNLADGA